MNKLLSLLALMMLLGALSACNTIHGFGKDVERGGERVQDAAQSTQKRM